MSKIKIIRATTVPMSLDAFCNGMLKELSFFAKHKLQASGILKDVKSVVGMVILCKKQQ